MLRMVNCHTQWVLCIYCSSQENLHSPTCNYTRAQSYSSYSECKAFPLLKSLQSLGYSIENSKKHTEKDLAKWVGRRTSVPAALGTQGISTGMLVPLVWPSPARCCWGHRVEMAKKALGITLAAVMQLSPVSSVQKETGKVIHDFLIHW